MLQIFPSKIYGHAIFLIRARGCQLTGSEIQRRFHLFLLLMYESVTCVALCTDACREGDVCIRATGRMYEL